MRLIARWPIIVVLALVIGVSSTFSEAKETGPAASASSIKKRLDSTSRHILDLKHKDPKVRAHAAKELGCS